MKAQLFSFAAAAVLASTAMAGSTQVQKFIYDDAAQELTEILKLKPDLNGDLHFATSDYSLDLSCFQGVRASCSVTGAFVDDHIYLYDEPAVELMQVINMEPDSSGNFTFLTADESLEIQCHFGLRAACEIYVREDSETVD